MNENYKKVEVLEYVKNGIENGTLIPFEAVKFARILARKGVLGETIKTMSVDDKNNPIIEKIDVVKKDENGDIDMVVSKATQDGKHIIDIHGNKNEWIIDNKTFNKKYELINRMENLYKPKGGPQIFVQISDNIILYQWDKDMKIASGGYINITNLDDIYGISERDYLDTYTKTNTEIKNIKI